MRIKNMIFFILGFVNLTLAVILIILVILGVRPLSISGSGAILLCLGSGIYNVIDNVETKKQRQKRREELIAMARLYGWDANKPDGEESDNG